MQRRPKMWHSFGYGCACRYYQDILAAHADCGLLLREGQEGDFAYAFPALAPWKVRWAGWCVALWIAGVTPAAQVASRPLLHGPVRATVGHRQCSCCTQLSAPSCIALLASGLEWRRTLSL